ncbi:hypothetical protein POVWA1_087950 [Plasmodium ovale wallikeri]|uniref:Uncharacterized protein n=2 Tax=Plasmodium ovale TaxID=36330 RepID=A0A1C3KVC4_PLAOA|nr:hypothetical protein POVWA1_087950 [Plasmodium ovale wallikeri]SBT78087.1 hypothetical protein POWCR01_120024500 [Plasmodium ovale]
MLKRLYRKKKKKTQDMLQNGDIRKIPDREAANVQDDIDLLEVIGENFVRQIANKAEREGNLHVTTGQQIQTAMERSQHLMWQYQMKTKPRLVTTCMKNSIISFVTNSSSVKSKWTL